MRRADLGMTDATKDYDMLARQLRVLTDERNQLSDDNRTLSEAIREIDATCAYGHGDEGDRLRKIFHIARRAATRGAMSE